MGAKPIYLQVQELRSTWRELWWDMADGVKSEYERIKTTDVFEFWKLFDLWRDKIAKEKEAYRQKNTQNQRHGK